MQISCHEQLSATEASLEDTSFSTSFTLISMNIHNNKRHEAKAVLQLLYHYALTAWSYLNYQRKTEVY